MVKVLPVERNGHVVPHRKRRVVLLNHVRRRRASNRADILIRCVVLHDQVSLREEDVLVRDDSGRREGGERVHRLVRNKLAGHLHGELVGGEAGDRQDRHERARDCVDVGEAAPREGDGIVEGVVRQNDEPTRVRLARDDRLQRDVVEHVPPRVERPVFVARREREEHLVLRGRGREGLRGVRCHAGVVVLRDKILDELLRRDPRPGDTLHERLSLAAELHRKVVGVAGRDEARPAVDGGVHERPALDRPRGRRDARDLVVGVGEVERRPVLLVHRDLERDALGVRDCRRCAPHLLSRVELSGDLDCAESAGDSLEVDEEAAVDLHLVAAVHGADRINERGDGRVLVEEVLLRGPRELAGVRLPRDRHVDVHRLRGGRHVRRLAHHLLRRDERGRDRRAVCRVALRDEHAAQHLRGRELQPGHGVHELLSEDCHCRPPRR
mmetsp:Transcript_32225/g.76554  ORF Transcript_32225/g.76554 Transcript_32225/m.76554 type:complete len:440 (-) Transcript_32225:1555-2874(-)